MTEQTAMGVVNSEDLGEIVACINVCISTRISTMLSSDLLPARSGPRNAATTYASLYSSTLNCDEIRSALIGLLADNASVDVDLCAETSRLQEMAVVLVVSYLTDTEPFRRILHATTGAHCIILVYLPKASGNPEGILRPFALAACRTFRTHRQNWSNIS